MHLKQAQHEPIKKVTINTCTFNTLVDPVLCAKPVYTINTIHIVVVIIIAVQYQNKSSHV